MNTLRASNWLSRAACWLLTASWTAVSTCLSEFSSWSEFAFLSLFNYVNICSLAALRDLRMLLSVPSSSSWKEANYFFMEAIFWLWVLMFASKKFLGKLRVESWRIYLNWCSFMESLIISMTQVNQLRRAWGINFSAILFLLRSKASSSFQAVDLSRIYSIESKLSGMEP